MKMKSITKTILPLAAIASLALIATSASAATLTYRNLILGDNPLVYYEFDESSGTTALNSATSGATYDGTLNGTITLGQTSVAHGGSAYDFGGGRVTFGATLGALTEWSVEAWMNYDVAGLSNSHTVGNDLGGWNDDVLIGMGPEGGLGGNGGGEFGVVQQGNPGAVRDGAGAAMTADAWHHVVVTGSTTAGELIVYIDGVAVDTNDSLTNGITFGDNPFVLGAKRASGGNEYNGLLDEVAIYSSALTPTQVSNHFNVVPEPSGILLLGFGSLLLLTRRVRS